MENVEIPALDTVDLEILMHRDVHFGKNFDIMIEYYLEDGVGAMPDFDAARMRELKTIEEQMKQDLSALLLPGSAKSLVERAKKAYFDLREVYSKEKPDEVGILISDLILSEEELPKAEMQKIIEKREKAVDPLIHLINSSDFYDPLFPGYGRSPRFAAKCLAEIGDPRSIQYLFNALGQENFFTDDAMISSITSFGEQAKPFLIRTLQHKPLSKDNEHAAIVLTNFPDDPEIAKACLEMLKQPDIQKKVPLATYLIFGCAALNNKSDQKAFKELSRDQNLSPDLHDEMRVILNSWK